MDDSLPFPTYPFVLCDVLGTPMTFIQVAEELPPATDDVAHYGQPEQREDIHD